jgi:4-aminobutyrate aminotransferase-like enzyme
MMSSAITFITTNMQAAVKLARHATKKQTVIVCRGGYHGRTMGTMAMTTSKTIYRYIYIYQIVYYT